MDRGAWWVTVHGIAKSQTKLKRLSTHSAHSGVHTCGASLSSRPSPLLGTAWGPQTTLAMSLLPWTLPSCLGDRQVDKQINSQSDKKNKTLM